MQNVIAVTYEGNVIVDYSKLPCILTVEETEKLIEYFQLALENAKELQGNQLNKIVEDYTE